MRSLPVVEVRASIIPAAGPVVASNVPARVDIVDGASLRDWQPRILPEVLSRTAGVSYYDDLGTPWKLNLTARGFSAGPTVGIPSGLTVFLDGVRQNEADAQEVNFDLLPIGELDRVELLNGNASLLGPNSLGGAINLVTPRGGGPTAAALEGSAASFGGYHTSATFSGTASHGWNYFANGGVGTESGWRQATGDRSYNALVNATHGDADAGFHIQALVSRSRAETAGSLPESIFGSAPRTNFTPGDFEDIDAQQLAVDGRMKGLGGYGTATLYGRRSAAERFNVNQAPDANVRGFTSSHTFGGTVDWRWTTDIGHGTLATRIGVDGAASAVRVRIFNEAQASRGDDTAVAGDDAGGLTTDVKSPGWNVAGYAMADYRYQRVTVSAGARADRVHIPFRDVLHSDDDDVSQYSRISPRAGVNVDVGRGISAYASAGSAFRAPAILELGCADPDAACPLPFALGDDPPLAPVRSTTYEIGARWLTEAVSLDASVYRTNVRHEIFFVASEGALLSGYFTNLDRTRREGLELSLQGAPIAGRLGWFANYAFTRATFETPAQLFSIRSDDDFASSAFAGSNSVVPGDRMPLVPSQQIKGGVSLEMRGGVSSGLDGQYVGKQWLRGDEANETTPLAPYTVVNGRVSKRLAAWRVGLAVTNLLDMHRPIFGTFNENRRTGNLERFLTPATARAFSVEVRLSL